MTYLSHKRGISWTGVKPIYGIHYHICTYEYINITGHSSTVSVAVTVSVSWPLPVTWPPGLSKWRFPFPNTRHALPDHLLVACEHRATSWRQGCYVFVVQSISGLWVPWEWASSHFGDVSGFDRRHSGPERARWDCGYLQNRNTGVQLQARFQSCELLFRLKMLSLIVNLTARTEIHMKIMNWNEANIYTNITSWSNFLQILQLISRALKLNQNWNFVHVLMWWNGAETLHEPWFKTGNFLQKIFWSLYNFNFINIHNSNARYNFPTFVCLLLWGNNVHYKA